MTLALVAQAGEHAVILAADSQGASQDSKPLATPVRKLFVRNACGIMTFGIGVSVPLRRLPVIDDRDEHKA